MVGMLDNLEAKEKARINPLLMKHLDKYMDPNFSSVERIIYYYVMLAKTICYDPEFYAANQRGIIAMIHEDPRNIENITPIVNECVCYEANLLLEKLVEKEGYKTQTVKTNLKVYGREHTSTVFTVDGYHITANLLSHATLNDALYSKLGLNLTGLKCINKDDTKVIQFQLMLRDITKRLDDITVQPEERELFKQMINFDEKSSFKSRIEKMMSVMKMNNNLGIMEKFGLLKFLYLEYFDEDELIYNINLTIGKEFTYQNRHTVMPIALMVINNEDVLNTDSNLYITYNCKNEFKTYTREELQHMFDIGKFEYLDYHRNSTNIGSYASIEGIEGKKKEYRIPK